MEQEIVVGQQEQANDQAAQNKLSQQQIDKINAFFQVPYTFVPPPIETNQQKTCYRKNIQQCIEPMTNIIKFFTSEVVETDPTNLGGSLDEILKAENSQSSKLNIDMEQEKNEGEKPAQELQDVKNTPIDQVKGELKLVIYNIFSVFHAILKKLYQGDDENDLKSAIQSLTQKIHNFFILSEKVRVFEARKVIINRMEAEIPKIKGATKQINDALREIEQFVSEKEVGKMEEQINEEIHEVGNEMYERNNIHRWDNYID